MTSQFCFEVGRESVSLVNSASNASMSMEGAGGAPLADPSEPLGG